MSAHRQLQRQFVRGDDRALASCPDPLALEVLVGVLTTGERHRRLAAWIFALLFVASALTIGLILLFSVDRVYVVVPFSLFLLGMAAVVLYTSPDRVSPKALLTIRTHLLPRATPEMVPALLDLCAVQGLELFSDQESLERQTEADVHAALTQLLPRFHDAAALTATQRCALRRLVVWYERSAPPLAIAALLLLGDAGDRALIRRARHWRRWHSDEKVATAAAEYLTAVEKRP